MVKQVEYKMWNKKGMGAGTLIGLFFILAILFVIFTPPKEAFGGQLSIGDNEIAILTAASKAEDALLYVDLSSKLSIDEAKKKFLENGGLYLEETEYASDIVTICGKHLYPLLNKIEVTGNTLCLPNYNQAFKSYFSDSLWRYYSMYKEIPLTTNYDFSLNQKDERTLEVIGVAKDDFKVPLFSSDDLVENNDILGVPKEIKYPRGPLGDINKEKIIDCDSSSCVANVANYYYTLYGPDGMGLPYVWGGESPYSYEDTISFGDDSFFDKSQITPMQPNKNKPTVPGFDCSGWVWWVNKHAGVDAFNNRLTANGFRVKARSEAEYVCGDFLFKGESEIPCTQEFVLSNAKPGDIVFTAENAEGKTTHTFIYVGNGEIIESKGSTGLIKRELNNGHFNGPYKINSIYRFPVEGSEKLIPEQNGCTLPIDFSQVKTEAPIIIWDRLDPFLENNDYKNIFYLTIEDYSDLNPNIIKSLLATSIGSQDLDHDYKSEFCVGDSCGPFKITRDDCKKYSFCDYDEIRKGDFESSVKFVINKFQSIYTQETCNLGISRRDYYFTILTYYTNCDFTNKLLQHVSERQKITKREVLWSDITLEDVETVYSNENMDDYNPEIILNLPSIFASFLKKECSGDPYAGIISTKPTSTNSYSINPSFRTDTTFNIEYYNKINEFALRLIDTCKDNLRECVSTEIDRFNLENPEILLERNSGEYALEESVAEQILDCSENQQSGCICSIGVDYSLPSTGDERTLKFSDDGKITSSRYGWAGLYKQEEEKELFKLDYTFTKSLEETGELNGDENIDEYTSVNLLFNRDTNKTTIDFDSNSFLDYIKDPLTYYSEFYFHPLWVNFNDHMDYIELIKFSAFDAAFYDRDSDIIRPFCADNKRYFPFTARTPVASKPLQFTVELEDIVPPSEINFDIEQSSCRDDKTVKLSFNLPPTIEEIYAVEIMVSKSPFVNPSEALDSQTFMTQFSKSLAEDDVNMDERGIFYNEQKPNNFVRKSIQVSKIGNTILKSNESYYFAIRLVDGFGNSITQVNSKFVNMNTLNLVRDIELFGCDDLVYEDSGLIFVIDNVETPPEVENLRFTSSHAFSCHINDEDQYIPNSFHADRMSYSSFLTLLEENSYVEPIRIANQDTGLSESEIRSFIWTETNAQILQGTQICNNIGMCGPMQVSRNACIDVNDRTPHVCDYVTLGFGTDKTMSILAGSAYLEWLINSYSELNPSRPDYYIRLAIAYNAGMGTLRKILDEVVILNDGVNSRNEVNLLEMLSEEAIRRALIDLGFYESWGGDTKVREIYNYPFYVITALTEECRLTNLVEECTNEECET